MANFSFQAVLRLVSKPFVQGAAAAGTALSKLGTRSRKTAQTQAALAAAISNTSKALVAVSSAAGQSAIGTRQASKALVAVSSAAGQSAIGTRQASKALVAVSSAAGQSAIGTRQASKALVAVSSASSQAAQSARRAKQAFTAASVSSRKLGQEATKAGSKLSALFQFAGASLLFRSLIQGVNAAQELNNRLRTLTTTETARIELYQQLFALSQRSYASLNATAASYQLLDSAVGGLGLSQQETLRIQETANKAIALGGSNATQAAAGMLQFVQAISGGLLRAEEYNSIIEQTPGLLDAVVIGLQKTGDLGDVGRSDLRALVLDGKLSADILVAALTAAGDEIDQRFAELTPTLSQALSQVQNAAQNSYRSLLGGANASSAALSQLAEHFYLVEGAVIALAAVMAGRLIAAIEGYIVKQLLAVRISYSQATAMAAQGAATAALTATTRIAIGAMGAFRAAMALAGGPVGLVITALTAGAAAWTLWGDNADEAADKTDQAADRMQSALAKLRQAKPDSDGFKAASANIDKLIKEQAQKIKNLQLQVAEALTAAAEKAAKAEKISGHRGRYLTNKAKEALQEAQALEQQLTASQDKQAEFQDKRAAILARNKQADAAEANRLAQLADKEQQVLDARLANAKRQNSLIGKTGLGRAKQQHQNRIGQIDAELTAETKRIANLDLQAAGQERLIGIAQQLAEVRTQGARATLDEALASAERTGKLTAERLALKQLGETAQSSLRLQNARDQLTLAQTSNDERPAAQQKIDIARIERTYQAEQQRLNTARQKINADLQQQKNQTAVLGDAASAQAKQAISALEAELGRLDQLIANAAQTRDTLIETVKTATAPPSAPPDSTHAGLPAWVLQGREAASRASSEIISSAQLATATGAQLFDGLGEGIVTAFTEGKGAAQAFFSSLLSDIAKVAARQAILRLISSAFGGGAGTTTAATAHSGGLVGIQGVAANPTRIVNPQIFVGAQRLHSGGLALLPGEVPAILQRGEEVLARRDPRHRLNQTSTGAMHIKVSVNNHSTAVATASARQTPGGVDLVVQLDEAIANVLAQPGSRSQQALRALGLSPALEGR